MPLGGSEVGSVSQATEPLCAMEAIDEPALVRAPDQDPLRVAADVLLEIPGLRPLSREEHKALQLGVPVLGRERGRALGGFNAAGGAKGAGGLWSAILAAF